MDAGLENLESKLTQLIVLCQSLRAENVNLRQELLQSRSEVKRLQDNVAAVGTRLEAVIKRLPGEET